LIDAVPVRPDRTFTAKRLDARVCWPSKDVKPTIDITEPRVAKALSHPIRIRILALLQGEAASPSGLSAQLGAPLSTVSYHFRLLESLGLVELVKTVPRRGAVEHFYRAAVRLQPSAATWAGLPDVVKQSLVATNLGDLGSQVNAAAAAGAFTAQGARLSTDELRLDDQGWRALAAELQAFAKKVERIEAEAQRRLRKAGDDAERRVTLATLLFETPQPAPSQPATTRRRSAKRAPQPT
jgi:DNA-binding transcriptional ArsR family regulator